VERKARLISEVGAYTGWDGAVAPEEYDLVFEKVDEAKERFLAAESKGFREREIWTEAWSFKDS
jgi:hypothetical protein